jgi:hypothetical protein
MTIVKVFGDFLRYLYQCTRAYIEDCHGTELWKSIEGNIEFVLTHPNGWRAPQLAQMRAAATYAGLVPDISEGYSRIRFVTEGEASLNYCVRNEYASDIIEVSGLTSRWQFPMTCSQSGVGVLLVDAGGGTIDLSAYHMVGTQNRFKQITPGTCAPLETFRNS